MAILVNTDGGTRGNPGPAAWAAVVRHPRHGTTNMSGFMEWATNNEAEYQALYEVMRYLNEKKYREQIIIRSDSELCVKQINGVYQVRNETLMPYWMLAVAEFEELKGNSSQLQLVHVRRTENKEADALCNQVMDEMGAVFVKHPGRTK